MVSRNRPQSSRPRRFQSPILSLVSARSSSGSTPIRTASSSERYSSIHFSASVGSDLGVELDSPGDVADPIGLRADRTAGEDRRALRWQGLIAVPLEGLEARRQRPDHRIGSPLLGHLDASPADLRLTRAPRGAPGGLGQQLRAQADRQNRHAIVDHRREEILLEAQPGMAVLLIGVHRATEGEDGVVVGDLELRPGPPLREQPLVQLHPALGHLVGEDARAGVRLVHDGQRSHR